MSLSISSKTFSEYPANFYSPKPASEDRDTNFGFNCPKDIWLSYRIEERKILDDVDESYRIIHRYIERLTPDSDIRAIMFPSIDRGVTCWSSFISLIQEKFPNCETIFVSQNYSYHHDDGTCSNDSCATSELSIQTQLLSAFFDSKISKLFLLDRQTFDEDYYDEKILAVTPTRKNMIGARMLYVEHEECDDTYSDHELTLNHLFSTMLYR